MTNHNYIIITLILLLSQLIYATSWTNDQISIDKVLAESHKIIGTNDQEIGYVVFSGVDATGDDTNDFLIGAHQDAVFVKGGFTQDVIYIDTILDGTNSYILKTGIYTGADFELCNDVNDDEIGDILVLAGRRTNTFGNYTFDIHVKLGTNISPDYIDWVDYQLPVGFIVSANTNIYFEVATYGSADINVDGINDIFAATYDNKHENIYIRYGNIQTNNIWNVLEVNGTNGMQIISKDMGRQTNKGDFNGDGNQDFVFNGNSGLTIIYGRQRFVKILSATNLPPEDGVTIKNASIGKNGGFGDINGDGIDDIIMPGGIVMFGRTNWGTNPDAATMGLGEIMYPTSSVANVYFGGFYKGGKTAVIGDLNGDGYDDWAIAAVQEIQIHPPVESNKFLVVYGKPIYPVNMEMWLLDSTNGFAIVDQWILSHTRGGDWDSDGYEEAIFGMPWEEDHKGIVTITPGGPSPAWSPYIFTPELIMEGRSNMVASTVLTNIVIGRKGKRHMVLADGTEPIEQEWLGTWFTTKVVRTSIDDTRTVNYWTTNILGRSNPATTLVINAVPEPGMIMAAMMIVIGIMTGRKSKS